MKSGTTLLSVPLSHLIPTRRNPRRVKPSREAHHRLIALIRSQGLLHPLVVRPAQSQSHRYEVVAGNRRLRALREIHAADSDPKIPCVLRDVDTATADAMSLGENFGREPMHPLDEAEAFAKLACTQGKDADAIAAEFGVTDRYVRQRMKLASLASPIKAAHREGVIDTATAEAFAAIPEDRQLALWKELDGQPAHAQHVRNAIAHAWIDAGHAQFDIATLPESAVSRDLFNDRVLVQRQAFMEAQVKALNAQRAALPDDGWKEVVVARREDVQDRLYAMAQPPPDFDKPTRGKLDRIAARQEKILERAKRYTDQEDPRLQRLQKQYSRLETQEQRILDNATQQFSEATKSIATIFLLLDPDGQVHREYRVPRQDQQTKASGNGNGAAAGVATEAPKPPTSDELSDKQLADTFTHQAIAVREAVLSDSGARKRLLALLLHEKVRSEALAVRHEPSGTTLHATADRFSSAVFEKLREKRAKLDPFEKEHYVPDVQAYERLGKLSPAKLDALIDLLLVDCITAHPVRSTELVGHLASQLKVNVREHWRPDAAWLSGFQKIQLAHLIVELEGAIHAPAPERKKAELVEQLAKLFADAAEGKLEDKTPGRDRKPVAAVQSPQAGRVEAVVGRFPSHPDTLPDFQFLR